MSDKTIKPALDSQPDTTGVIHSAAQAKGIAPKRLSRRAKHIRPLPKRHQRRNGGQGQNWPAIIWREWVTSEDKEYAEQLFDLVGQAKLGWGSSLVVALCGTLYGLLSGYWLGLILIYWNTHTEQWISSHPLALALTWLGGLAGGLIGLGVSVGLSWRMWLNALTPKIFGQKSGLMVFNATLLTGFITNLAGLNLIWSIFLGILAGLIMLDVNQSGSISSKAISGTFEAGQRDELIAFGFISIAGTLIGHLFMSNGWLGIVVGAIIGAWLGVFWSGGLAGIIISWLGVLTGLILGLDRWVMGWLSLGVGFGLGVIPNLVGYIPFERAYRQRGGYFWWRNQPPAYKVELALHLSPARTAWANILAKLTGQKEQPAQAESLLTDLQSEHWPERFVARHTLISLGGKAIPTLQKVAADREHPLWNIALWLLGSIEEETTNRLAWRTAYILCPRCLARFDRRAVEVGWGVSFGWYGCRLCGQSREFLDCPQGVTAVLDASWSETQSYQDNRLRVNWLARRQLFDFDRVEIIRAGDEDVERFAVQAGNDTDPFRTQSYRQIHCAVGPQAQLSANSLRVLGKIFGQVERL